MIDQLSPQALEAWNDYLSQLSEHPDSPFVEASFAGTRETTDDLIELYLEGKKTAGSGLVKDYQSTQEPLPKVENFWIVLDSRDQPCLINKTIRVEINRFKDIPSEIAIAEGEGDLSVEAWKQIHQAFYLPFLDQWGVDSLDEAEVVTEFFERVWVPRNKLT